MQLLPFRSPTRHEVGLGLALLFAIVPLDVARAQQWEEDPMTSTPDAREDREEARRLYVDGEAAAAAGNWTEAVELFKRSYQLSGVPAALYNTGFALRALGRFAEARDAFEDLLLAHSDLDDDVRQRAERFREESAARVAVLGLVGLDGGRTYQVSLDGQAVADDGRRPLDIEVEAGTHSLIVRHSTTNPFVWEGRVREGQRLAIEVRDRTERTEGSGLLAATSGEDSAETDRDESSSLFSKPLFWIATAAVLAGGAVAGYFILQEQRLEGRSSRVYEL